MTVYVVEGPKGVVSLHLSRHDAQDVRSAMLAKGEWAQVKEMEVKP
jgi:hypothetical protein